MGLLILRIFIRRDVKAPLRTGGGKPRPYGFCLASGENVGATLEVARIKAPLVRGGLK